MSLYRCNRPGISVCDRVDCKPTTPAPKAAVREDSSGYKPGYGCRACGMTGDEYTDRWTGKPCPGCSPTNPEPENEVTVTLYEYAIGSGKLLGWSTNAVPLNPTGRTAVAKFTVSKRGK